MANKNTTLGNAAKAKKDEFYTQLTDIEKEMRHYRKHFKGKTVFCNCDDPFESNFFKFFVLNFNSLGLKRLICTCYAGSPISHNQISLFDVGKADKDNRKPYKAIVTTVYDKTGDGYTNMEDIKELFKSGENELSELDGDGDFASDECINLMKESDIVVTNPPFSQFRKYVATLMDYEKKFIIIGNQNAITYKEIFPLLKDNRMWLGHGFNRNCAHFISPYQDTASDLDHKEGMIRVSGVMWYTNLDLKKRHEEMVLIKRYKKEDYPTYCNYDAINIDSTTNIPCDYAGKMGVPITFLTKYNPDQFEILGISLTSAKAMSEIAEDGTYMNGGRAFYTPCPDKKDIERGFKYHRNYARIVIRNKHPEPPKEV